jgi:phage tail sheath protein FI
MSSDMRAPGVYFEKVEDRIPPLEVGPTGQLGLLGLATRGPLHKPVRLTSYEQFLEVYGAPLEGGYLADSVKGFFLNGGHTCYVVRVAHTFRRGRTQVATQAAHTLLDRAGQPTALIEACNEGAWGNEITLRVSRPEAPPTQTLLVRDAAQGERRLQVRSTRGFQVGTVCKLDDGAQRRYLVLDGVEGKDLLFRDTLDATFKSSAPTFVEPVTFDLEAEIPGYRERFTQLSMAPSSGRHFARLINAESQILRVTDLQSPSPLPDSLPEEIGRAHLQGGHDGLEDLTPQDFIGFNNGPAERYGLGALEAVEDVDLLCIPDLFAAREFSGRSGFRLPRDVEAVQEAMITHCERLRDRFAILDVPPGAGYEQVLQWRRQFDSAFAAFYFPWLIIPQNDRRRRRAVPPSAFVAGVYARSDERHGVHKPPANEIIEGIVDLDVLLSDTHLGLLNHEQVNCIKNVATRGLRIWGARTISSDTDWRYVNVRRIFNALRRSLDHGTQWVTFEPNTPTLWGNVARNVQVFLERLWRQGYFQGSSPDQGFYVRCDQTTNTRETVDAGLLICEVGIAPVKPAEFIVFRIKQEVEDRASEDSTRM